MKNSLVRFHNKQEVAEVIGSALQRSTEMTLWGTGDGNEHLEQSCTDIHMPNTHKTLRIHKS